MNKIKEVIKHILLETLNFYIGLGTWLGGSLIVAYLITWGEPEKDPASGGVGAVISIILCTVYLMKVVTPRDDELKHLKSENEYLKSKLNKE